MKALRRKAFAVAVLAAFLAALIPALALAVPRADASVKVYVNGSRVSFPDEVPWIDAQAGRVLVPMRFVSEALGAKVQWFPATRTVAAERNGNVVSLIIGSNVVTKNGQTIVLDVAPHITGKGRTLVPLRFISEAFGAKVDWKEAERAVYITDDAQQPGSGGGSGSGSGSGGSSGGTPAVGEGGFPVGAKRVGSAKDLMWPVPRADFVSDGVPVYEAVVDASDLPQPCGTAGVITGIQIDRDKFTQYEQPAIKVTLAGGDPYVQLVIVANGGKDVRWQQIDRKVQGSSGGYELYFCGNTLAERNDGKPLLKPEDVDYFGISTVGWTYKDPCGVVWIKNPYKTSS